MYLVHDLQDPAVRRRVRFLREGGAVVSLLGFERRGRGVAGGDTEGRVLGLTRNGRFGQRIVATLRAALFSRTWRGAMHESDVIVARTLEALLVAVLTRARSRAATPIAYECLDIHRLMIDRGPAGRLLRWIEQRLLDRSSLLIVSSARFVDRYFDRAHLRLPRWMLLENKLLGSELGRDAPMDAAGALPADGPPWRIGWFGILRCRRSLLLLADLVRSSGGTVRVEIHGRPALDVVTDFYALVAATPGMTFHGSYDRAIDLARLYGSVHFNWTLDFYEAGLNSDWLLPNRLYEGSVFGVVPLAFGSVETGRWIARHDCGVLLEEPLWQSLEQFFADLDPAAYHGLRGRVGQLNPMDLVETAETATRFVQMLEQLRPADHVGVPGATASERYGTT